MENFDVSHIFPSLFDKKINKNSVIWRHLIWDIFVVRNILESFILVYIYNTVPKIMVLSGRSAIAVPQEEARYPNFQINFINFTIFLEYKIYLHMVFLWQKKTIETSVAMGNNSYTMKSENCFMLATFCACVDQNKAKIRVIWRQLIWGIYVVKNMIKSVTLINIYNTIPKIIILTLRKL